MQDQFTLAIQTTSPCPQTVMYVSCSPGLETLQSSCGAGHGRIPQADLLENSSALKITSPKMFLRRSWKGDKETCPGMGMEVL